VKDGDSDDDDDDDSVSDDSEYDSNDYSDHDDDDDEYSDDDDNGDDEDEDGDGDANKRGIVVAVKCRERVAAARLVTTQQAAAMALAATARESTPGNSQNDKDDKDSKNNKNGNEDTSVADGVVSAAFVQSLPPASAELTKFGHESHVFASHKHFILAHLCAGQFTPLIPEAVEAAVGKVS
jgi:hypothetical protein